MRQKKVQEFSAFGSKTASIPLNNPGEVKGKEKVGEVKRQPTARSGDERAEGEEKKWAERGKEV